MQNNKKNNNKYIFYGAVSKDNFLAGENDDLSFLDETNQWCLENKNDLYYSDVINDCNTLVMGRKTYDYIIANTKTWPYKDKETYVFTSTKINNKYVKSINMNVNEFNKTIHNKNVWLVGGANLVQQFHDHNLINKWIILTIENKKVNQGVKFIKWNKREFSENIINNNIKIYKKT